MGFVLCFIIQSQGTSLNLWPFQNQEDAILNKLYSCLQNDQEITQQRDLYINSLKIRIVRLKAQKKILKESINTIFLKGYLEIKIACFLNHICLNKMNLGRCGENNVLYCAKLLALSIAETGLFLDGIYNLFNPRANIKAIQTQLDRDIGLLTQLETIRTEQ